MAIATKWIGIVQADGSIKLEGEADLPVGTRVEVVAQVARVPEIRSMTLEEAKAWVAQEHPPLTEEQEAEYERIYDRFEEVTTDSAGLPDDYPDELDHYLYGTPKRGDE